MVYDSWCDFIISRKTFGFPGLVHPNGADEVIAVAQTSQHSLLFGLLVHLMTFNENAQRVITQEDVLLDNARRGHLGKPAIFGMGILEKDLQLAASRSSTDRPFERLMKSPL